MHNGEFWLLTEKGDKILRDLEAESKTFTQEAYRRGEFDSFNYVYYENFNCYDNGSIGSDYERHACTIHESDVVLDVGGNIGAFSRRAEERGASRVIAIEPLTPTYECLKMNAGPKTEAYKFGLAGVTSFPEFELHTNFTHIGGGSMHDVNKGRTIIHKEKALCLNVNHFFESGLFEKIDFMKVDIEGGEYDLFRSIKNEHLEKMRCIALELHASAFPDADQFQEVLIKRLDLIGFSSFCLYYGDGNLRTVTFAKR
jgi:FkbM family methyltransferase